MYIPMYGDASSIISPRLLFTRQLRAFLISIALVGCTYGCSMEGIFKGPECCLSVNI